MLDPQYVPVADAHSDLLLELTYARHRLEEPRPFAHRWLPPLRRGGVALQVCAIYVEGHLLPEAGLREALRQATEWARILDEHPDEVVGVRCARDVERIGRDRIGLVLALESADCLGLDPWAIEPLARLGVRIASLTWSRRNAFADGTGGDGGLTALGRELIDRIVDLGLVLDLAHAGDRSFHEILDHSADAPLLVSHAACRALLDHPRNLPDEQLQALAARGGLLGVMPHPLTIDPRRPTVDRVVDHIVHAIDVMGVRHVALGGDFLRQIAHATALAIPSAAAGTLAADAAIEQLAGPQHYPRLTASLRDRGLEPADVAAVMGGNLLRFLSTSLPVAAP